MGKMVYLMLGVIAVQISLYLVFDIGIPTSSLWELFRDPSNWNSLSLTSLISDAITAISAIAFVGGLIFKNDLAVFGGLAGVFYTFGKQLVELYRQIYAQPTFGDSVSAPIVASIIISPIILLYILTVLEWWRGRD